MKAIHNPAIRYRPEIDGLRAVAILPVILFHAGLQTFSGGYVGVDIFFVISGYLITSILRRELEQGNFSVIRFYERRARRILPALFVVVVCTLPFAWALMLPEEINRLGETIVRLGQFASNLYFAGHIDYFSPTAETNPLLHTWSLAVEEQYYLLFPLLLMFFWRGGRRRTEALIIVLIVLSLGLAEWQSRTRPVDDYYLLQTRAWEMLMGSLLALWGRHAEPEMVSPLRKGLRAALPVTGLLLIGWSVVAYDSKTPFPSLYALVPVIGAVLVIRFASGTCIASRLLASKPFVGVGLISYSAYLWHQPLLAFARVRSIGAPEPLLLQALAALSLLLAFLTWKYVEAPFRDGKQISRRQIFSYSLVGLAGLAIVGNGAPVLSAHAAAGTRYAAFAASEGAIAKNEGIPLSGCGDRSGAFNADQCSTSPHAQVLLWGDSFAMHLAQFLEHQPGGMLQATKSSCFPNTRLTPFVDDRGYTREWARTCHTFAQNVLDYARRTPDVRVVVIASTWTWPLMYDAWDGATVRRPSHAELVEAIRQDVADLRAAGKRVILIAPTPQNASEALRCAKKQLRNTAAKSGSPDFGQCHFEGTLGQGVEPFLEEVGRAANVNVFDLRPFLCTADHLCSPVVDDTPVYFDWGHLTPLGARLLERKFGVGERILQSAT